MRRALSAVRRRYHRPVYVEGTWAVLVWSRTARRWHTATTVDSKAEALEAGAEYLDAGRYVRIDHTVLVGDGGDALLGILDDDRDPDEREDQP